MVRKIGLLVAALAASATLALALALAGFAPGAPAVVPAAQVVQQTLQTDPSATPQVVYDNTYVQPQATPPTVVLHQTVPSTGGEHEGAENGD